MGVPVSIHSHGWFLVIHLANILYRCELGDFSAVASS